MLEGNNRLNAEFVIPLKYLCNILRFPDLPLISCEIELDLRWTKTCIISEVLRAAPVARVPDANPSVEAVNATEIKGTTFQTNNAKRNAPFVTFSINDNVKLLEKNSGT